MAHVDMQVADLKTLLTLPRDLPGLGAGCNFPAALIATNLIAGASVLFWEASITGLERRGDRSKRFRELAAAKYPWSDADAVMPEEGARLPWDYTRNPPSHTLGIGKTKRLFPGIPSDEREVWLAKPREGLDPAEVEVVLSSLERPEALDPTISSGDDGYTISVLALSWGVQRMLRDLFRDEGQATMAEETANALFEG